MANLQDCEYFYKNFKRIPKRRRERYLKEFIAEREINKPIKVALSKCLARILSMYFKDILKTSSSMISMAKSLLASLLKDKDLRTTDDLYTCVAENFNSLGMPIRALFLEAAASDEDTARLVSRSLIFNYDKMPKPYREKLLRILADRQSSITNVGNILSIYFNKISEELRENLLLKIEDNEKNRIEFFTVLIDNYRVLPNHIIEKLFESAQKDEETISELLWYLDRKIDKFDKLPSHYWDRLCSISVNSLVSRKTSQKVAVGYLINILIKYKDKLGVNIAEVLLRIFENVNLDKSQIHQIEYYFSTLNNPHYNERLEKIKQMRI